MCQPRYLSLQHAATEHCRALESTPIKTSSSLPQHPKSRGDPSPPPCLIIDVDGGDGPHDLATWHSSLCPVTLPKLAPLQGTTCVGARPSWVAEPRGMPQLRMAAEDSHPDWAQRQAHCKLWEGWNPISTPLSDSDADTETSEESPSVALRRQVTGALDPFLLPLLISVDDQENSGMSSTELGGNPRTTTFTGLRDTPSTRIKRRPTPWRGEASSLARQQQDKLASQPISPVIPRESAPPSLSQTCPDCLVGDDDDCAVMGTALPPAPRTDELGFPPSPPQRDTCSCVQQSDLLLPMSVSPLKPRRRRPSRRVRSSGVSSMESGQPFPIVSSPLSRSMNAAEASQHVKSTPPRGARHSIRSTDDWRHRRIETDTSMLEGKLELLTLQRSMYAAKCHKFLQYLEGHSDSTSSVGAGPTAGTKSSDRRSPARHTRPGLVTREPAYSSKLQAQQFSMATSMQGVHVPTMLTSRPLEGFQGKRHIQSPCA